MKKNETSLIVNFDIKDIPKYEAQYPGCKVITLDRVVEEVENDKGIIEEIVVDWGKTAIFKKPNRVIITKAMNSVMRMDQTIDMITGGAIILRNCWVAGDPEMEKDDRYYFRVCQELNAWINEIAGFTTAS